ncbi:MAG: HlyD family efflux transporter periplasmic adaptor subunit [Pirellulales bacterium]
MSTDANRKEPNSVSLVELERLRLAAEQARIKILVADQEHRFRGLEAQGFAAKSLQAEIDVRARRVVAPIAGEIVETFFRPGEWVEPGKPLLRMVRLDRLRLEGFVAFDAVRPSRLKNAEVEAQRSLCRRTMGKIFRTYHVRQPAGSAGRRISHLGGGRQSPQRRRVAATSRRHGRTCDPAAE